MTYYRKLPKPKDTLSPLQASQLLRVGQGTLAKWAKIGRIQVEKVGRLNRYPASEVRRFIWAENPQATARKLVELMEIMVLANNEENERQASSGRKLRKRHRPDQESGDS